MGLRKIEAMHQAYGVTNHFCKDCCNFLHKKWDKTYRKCLAYGDTNCTATDWKAGNMACGLFGVSFEATGKKPLIEMVKHQRVPKQAERVPEGQVAIWEDLL